PNAPSVRGLEVIQQRFPAGETGPITVLLAGKADWVLPEGRRTIDKLSRGFAYLGNIVEVRSLTQPLGKPLPELPRDTETKPKNALASLLQGAQNGLNSLMAAPLKKAKAHYVAKIDTPNGPQYVTRLDVVPATDPFDAATVNTLEQIEAWLKHQKPDGVE